MSQTQICPRKRQREEKVDEELDWGNDDCITPEVIAQVDFVASQAFSQPAKELTPLASPPGTRPLQRHRSWAATPTKNSLPLLQFSTSKSTHLWANRVGSNNWKPWESKSWTNFPPFVEQNLPTVLLHEAERLRRKNTQAHPMDGFPGPRKKQRLEKMDDDLDWGDDDDITPDVIAQADFVASQAFSQLANAPTIPLINSATQAFQRHNSWSASPNENVLPAPQFPKSKSALLRTNRTGENNQMPAVSKSWTDSSPFVGQNLPAVSLHDFERLKQDLKSLREEKILHERQLKQMNEVVAKKNLEIQWANERFDGLKQQSAIEENRKQAQLQEIERLKTELRFKCQELASVQWKVCQQQSRSNSHNNVSKLTPSPGTQTQTQTVPKIFKSPLKVNDDDGQCFPSQSTFSKRLAVKRVDDVPKNSKKAKTTSSPLVERSHINNASLLSLKRPSGIEIGPSLVGSIFRRVCEDSRRAGFSPDSERSVASETFDPRSILDKFLEDDASVNEREDAVGPDVPPEFGIFKRCLDRGMNRVKLVLPSILSALSAALERTDSPLGQFSKTSLANAVGTLRVLKRLCHCCPRMRRPLVFAAAGSDLDEVDGYDYIPPSRPGPSHRNLPTVSRGTKPAFHPVVLKLFELCSLPCEFKCNLEADLLQMLLEIIRTIASDCPCNELERFLTLLTPRMVQNGTALVMDGIVLIEFASLLATLCANPIFVEGTCNRDGGLCVWNPLAGAWRKARNELTQSAMFRLDSLMLQTLSLCLTHEGTPPFLVSRKVHCQAEVVAGLVLNLHHQQKLFEDGDKSSISIPMLQKGISLLHQVAGRDADFRRHRVEVAVELSDFLHWLIRVKEMPGNGAMANSVDLLKKVSVKIENLTL